MRMSLIFLCLLFGTLCFADSTVENQIKNSFLTLSAFECSVVAPNEKEADRLFKLGLNAGREYIAYAQEHSDSYANDLQPHVAILWNMISGPSPDFILGQIYANRVDEIYKDFSSDEVEWKIRKDNMYREKNCGLIGK